MRCNKGEPPAPRTKPTGALKLRARGVRRDHGVTCFSLLLGPHGHVMFVRPEGLTCSRAPRGANVVGKENLGRPDGHKQVAHNRSGSCPCPGPRLVFAAALNSYCAHGKPAASHNAGAAATVAIRAAGQAGSYTVSSSECAGPACGCNACRGDQQFEEEFSEPKRRLVHVQDQWRMCR